MTGLLRRLDDRLDDVEATLGLTDTGALIDAPDDLSPATVNAVAAAVAAPGRALVLSCGGGALVAALGSTAVGIDEDALRILPGVKDGLDLRAGDPKRHLAGLADDALDTLVLTGFIEDLAAAAAWSLIEDARRVVADDGLVVVVATDPANRDVVERDVRHGRGLAPATWAHLLHRGGAAVTEHPVDDPRHGVVVAGRLG